MKKVPNLSVRPTALPNITNCTLLVLFNFCPILSEFLTWSFVYKNFLHFGKNDQWKSNRGLTFLHFKFKPLYLHYWYKKNFHFWWNNVTFKQQHLNTGSKTQNVEKLSLDLIFIDNFCHNIKSVCKQNSLLRIHSKHTKFTQNQTEIDKNFQSAMYLPN